jgi:hypothetical protein
LSASFTIGVMLSGTTTLNAPPKNRHAASQPAITAARVCENVNQTNMCLDTTAVNTSAWTFRRLPDSRSNINPRYPKSTWTSSPGTPSATRTVVSAAR